MNPSAYTVGAAMVVALVTALLYDVYLEQDDVARNTYSEVLRKWFKTRSWLYYFVSFAMGVLMAHWGLK